jgi:type VI secretion system protein ImpH
VWDQQGSFVVTLGPLRMSQFLDFLPPSPRFPSQGGAFPAACELARFYTGMEFDFRFRLILRAEDVPESRLGTAQLGWTSWLKTVPSPQDDSQVRLSPS